MDKPIDEFDDELAADELVTDFGPVSLSVGEADIDDLTDEDAELLDLEDVGYFPDFDDVDRDDDPIQVVCPGDSGGWAHLVNRSLGFGDAAVYGSTSVAKVAELQEEHGLPEDGIVSGATWSLVLPELRIEEKPIGQEVAILRRLLGLGGIGGWSSEVVGLLQDFGYEGSVVDQEVWEFLILTAMDSTRGDK